MSEDAALQPEPRRDWWERRRGAFSWAVFGGFAGSVVAFEKLTPGWAGDHVGLSAPALLIVYGPAALICLAVANGAFWLPRLIEPKEPQRIDTFRRRAYLASIVGGVVFAPVLTGLAVLEAWFRHRQ